MTSSAAAGAGFSEASAAKGEVCSGSQESPTTSAENAATERSRRSAHVGGGGVVGDGRCRRGGESDRRRERRMW